METLIADGLAKNPNELLTDEQKAISNLMQIAIESTIYWGIVKQRWVDHWLLTKKAFFSRLPSAIRN
jgi:hypothetical protein